MKIETMLKIAEDFLAEGDERKDQAKRFLGYAESTMAKMNVDSWENESQCCPCGDESHAPPAVIDAIVETFPREAESILKELRYHGGFDRYWSFYRWGMFVGVEPDGYIHS